MLCSCAGCYLQLSVFVSRVEAGGGPAPTDTSASPGVPIWSGSVSWAFSVKLECGNHRITEWFGMEHLPIDQTAPSLTQHSLEHFQSSHPFLGCIDLYFRLGRVWKSETGCEDRLVLWISAMFTPYWILTDLQCSVTAVEYSGLSWIQTITGLHKNTSRSFQLEMNHRLNTVVVWKKEAAPFSTKNPHTFWILFRIQGVFLDPPVAWQRSLDLFLQLVAGSEGKWLCHCDVGILYPAHDGVRMSCLGLPDPSWCWRGTPRVWNARRALSAVLQPRWEQGAVT